MSRRIDQKFTAPGWRSVRAAILGVAPLLHITGLVAELALSIVTGAPLILFHRFDAARALDLAARWGATLSTAAITAYIAMMNAMESIERFPPKCYSGGAPVPRSVADQFERRFGVYIHNIYGPTESNSPSHAVRLGSASAGPSSERSAIDWSPGPELRGEDRRLGR